MCIVKCGLRRPRWSRKWHFWRPLHQDFCGSREGIRYVSQWGTLLDFSIHEGFSSLFIVARSLILVSTNDLKTPTIASTNAVKLCSHGDGVIPPFPTNQVTILGKSKLCHTRGKNSVSLPWRQYDETGFLDHAIGFLSKHGGLMVVCGGRQFGGVSDKCHYYSLEDDTQVNWLLYPHVWTWSSTKVTAMCTRLTGTARSACPKLGLALGMPQPATKWAKLLFGFLIPCQLIDTLGLPQLFAIFGNWGYGSIEYFDATTRTVDYLRDVNGDPVTYWGTPSTRNTVFPCAATVRYCKNHTHCALLNHFFPKQVLSFLFKENFTKSIVLGALLLARGILL